MKRGSYYIVIPAPVRHDDALQEGAKLLFGDLAGLSDKYGYCFATDAHLASVTGKSSRQVRAYLHSLEEAGHITREETEGQRRIYLDRKKMSYPPEENSREDTEENSLHTNTSTTNTSTKSILDDVTEYFQERGATAKSSRMMAHSFVEWYSQPDKPQITRDRFRGRAATWFRKADAAGEVEYAKEERAYTLEEIRQHATLEIYDKTAFRKGADGMYYARN